MSDEPRTYVLRLAPMTEPGWEAMTPIERLHRLRRAAESYGLRVVPPPRGPRACAHCGAEFRPRCPRQRACSRSCGARARATA
jgi:hypothetical protein